MYSLYVPHMYDERGGRCVGLYGTGRPGSPGWPGCGLPVTGARRRGGPRSQSVAETIGRTQC